MRSLDIEVTGDISFCVQDDEIERVVNFFTSDYHGTVKAFIFFGDFRQFEGHKVVVTTAEGGQGAGEIGLIKIEKYFFCMINTEYVNGREGMFLMDSTPMTINKFLRLVNVPY